MQLRRRFWPRSWRPVLLLGLLGAVSHAEPEPVLLKVGSISLSAAQLTQRFESLSGLEREALGRTPSAQLLSYVDQRLVPQLLTDNQARQSGLDKRLTLVDRRRDVLRGALVTALETSRLTEQPITEAETRSFFDGHPELFKQPERLRLFRILVADEASAAGVLKRVRGAASLEVWKQVAREVTLDKATAERGGDLGMVRADGTTDVPELEVNPALFQAAKAIADGMIVPTAVAEGSRFAVLWRRGSLPATSRTFSEELPRIAAHLRYLRGQQALEAWLAAARQQSIREVHPERLEALNTLNARSSPPVASGASSPR